MSCRKGTMGELFDVRYKLLQRHSKGLGPCFHLSAVRCDHVLYCFDNLVRRSFRVSIFKIGSPVLQGGKNCTVLRVVPIYSAPPQSLSFLNWPPTFRIKKLHGLSPRANYIDRATAACRRSDYQLLRIDGATWSAWRVPTAVFSVF
jgi:hypothetical protein